MTIKALELQPWMEHDLNPLWRGSDHQLLGSKDYPEITPVFNRDGIYLKGNECWAEIQGRAFKYDIKQFKFDLELLNADEHDEHARRALREICKVNLATKAQRRLLYMIDVARECRQTRLRSMMYFAREVKPRLERIKNERASD